jgi:hypothetical protein
MGYEDYRILLDLPSPQPALGFDRLANAFADIIEQSVPQFAIGIFGGWGSGKTTLMRQIERQLDQQKIICVPFSVWRYQKETHLIIPLLDAIRDALADWAKTHHENKAKASIARRTAAMVGRVASALLEGTSFSLGVVGFEPGKTLEKLTEEMGGPPDLADADKPRSLYHASFRTLSEAFDTFCEENPNGRIVVFVDDLDRCLPEGALDMLESMKLFFDLPGFIFVVGLDRQVVEWIIDHKYRRKEQVLVMTETDGGAEEYQIRGSDYVKKMFQVPFSLPPVAINQIDEFLWSIAAEANLSPQQGDDLRERVRHHLRYVVSDVGINPREIKRYINAYTLQMKISPHLNPDTVLALQTITFQPDWEPAQKALYLFEEMFLETLRRQVDGEDDRALENLEPFFGPIPQSFLRYISRGAPGHSLVLEGQIDPYIYSGRATTQSRDDPGLSRLFRDLGELVRAINELPPLAAEVDPTTQISELLERIGRISRNVKQYSSQMGSQTLMSNLKELEQSISKPETYANTEVHSAIVRRILNDFFELYRYSTFSAPS